MLESVQVLGTVLVFVAFLALIAVLIKCVRRSNDRFVSLLDSIDNNLADRLDTLDVLVFDHTHKLARLLDCLDDDAD